VGWIFYRHDGGDIKGTREELLARMAAVTIEKVLTNVSSN
jgi:hypothetical protein